LLPQSPHIIDAFYGVKNTPLVILMGGIHGNETAGVEAIEMAFRFIATDMLQGSIVGLKGNLAALAAHSRFITRDLNRLWTPENVMVTTIDHIDALDDISSLYGLVNVINQVIDHTEPSEIYFMDLHTTSSDGGIFCILTDNPDSIDKAQLMGLPCVYDLLKNVSHSALHYIQNQPWDIQCYAMAFEGGHYKDPFSIYRSFAAIMRWIKIANISDQSLLDNPYEHMLEAYGQLPQATYVKYRYPIVESRFFMMKPGYKHFSPITKGEIVGRYDGEHIISSMDGYILMPLYQKQGGDGFYIIAES
jgi:succinylglutamate desuccinylase